jgi:HAD superfamily hydrolase (TIGR01484 family)
MKTEIQMIVTDLDRSLLRNDKTISEYTIEIFKKCREKNIIIVFATARPKRSTMTFEKQIYPNSVIYLNGAIVTVKQEILKRNSIKNLLAKEIIKNIGEKYPEATISVEMNDIMYTNFDFDSKLGVTVHGDSARFM